MCTNGVSKVTVYGSGLVPSTIADWLAYSERLPRVRVSHRPLKVALPS